METITKPKKLSVLDQLTALKQALNPHIKTITEQNEQYERNKTKLHSLNEEEESSMIALDKILRLHDIFSQYGEPIDPKLKQFTTDAKKHFEATKKERHDLLRQQQKILLNSEQLFRAVVARMHAEKNIQRS